MTKYIVVLPKRFPGNENESVKLREAYRNMTRQIYSLRDEARVAAVSDAPTSTKAITNVIFRNVSNLNNQSKNIARMLTSIIFGSNSHETYEMPEVVNEDDSPIYNMRERHKDEEICLAQEIASERKIDNLEALKSARRLMHFVRRIR